MDARRERLDRAETLLSIQRLTGIEITGGALAAAGLPAPDFPLPVPPWITLPDLNESYAVSRILTPHTEFSNMALVDLARGCPNHCTFCWVGQNSPPYRVRAAGKRHG